MADKAVNEAAEERVEDAVQEEVKDCNSGNTAAQETETDSEENQAEEQENSETQDAEETSEDAGEADEKKKEGKFFKKKKDKKDELIEELNDKYTRLFAEFDNFRKRSEKEKTAMFEVGAKSIVEKVLPIIDNFERGLATVPEEEKESGFAEGMEKVYKQLVTSLEEAGVKQIEAMDQEFDPNLHNAVMHVEDENFGENIIVEEFQKGYTYRDSVVRHSMVKVAN